MRFFNKPQRVGSSFLSIAERYPTRWGVLRKYTSTSLRVSRASRDRSNLSFLLCCAWRTISSATYDGLQNPTINRGSPGPRCWATGRSSTNVLLSIKYTLTTAVSILFQQQHHLRLHDISSLKTIQIHAGRNRSTGVIATIPLN
jgi:hypothetical protein